MLYEACKKNIAIPNASIIFEYDSPNCGYQPISDGSGDGTNFQKRAYSMSSSSTTVTLTTHVFYVDVDEWTGNIKRDYPCSPSQVQWSYILWR